MEGNPLRIPTLIRPLAAVALVGLATSPLLGANAAARPALQRDVHAAATPARTWVESYPALLRYAHMPVIVPQLGSMTSTTALRLATQGHTSQLLGTCVEVSRDGYRVQLSSPSLPPWPTEQPSPGAGSHTAFAFAGAKATGNFAAYDWLDLPADVDFAHLPGLPNALSGGRTGYVTYTRNLGGNGGSLTTITWLAGGYVYQVSVPIAAGSGGRTSAIALADHMVRLTAEGVRRAILRPFVVFAQTGEQSPPAYRDTVRLLLDASSLPDVLATATPAVSNWPYPPFTNGVHKGIGRGYAWTYEMQPEPVATVAPAHYTLAHMRVIGATHAGGMVIISGTITPAPKSPIVLAVNWSLRSKSLTARTYPPDDALEWWGTPYNVAFYSLPHVHVKGNRVTASLPIPRAIYTQGAGASASNQWLIVNPGIYHPDIVVNNALSNQDPVRVDVLPGVEPVGTPTEQRGPYLASGHNLPPVAAWNLAYYGLGSYTAASSVPVLLPAWIPGSVDPYTLFLPYPRSYFETVPGGYAAIQDRPGTHATDANKSHTWPADLAQAALVVYGVRGHSAPYAAELQHLPAARVHIGDCQARAYNVSDGTLITLSRDGVQYGIFAAHPASAADTLDMARSLTEIDDSAPTDPANAVRVYSSLLRASARGHFPGLVGQYSTMWLFPPDFHMTKTEQRLDHILSHWRNLQVQILATHDLDVTAAFSGVLADSHSRATLTADFRVTPAGGLQLLTMSSVNTGTR